MESDPGWPRFCTVKHRDTGRCGRLEYRTEQGGQFLGRYYVRWFLADGGPGIGCEWVPVERLERASEDESQRAREAEARITGRTGNDDA